MKQRIILLSIGSVQEFIINSKKSSDLLSSSKIFSNLINEGIKFLLDMDGQLLLPKIQVDNHKIKSSINQNNLPNYFIIKYKSDSSLAETVEKHMRNFYVDKFIKNKGIKGINGFQEQICDHLNSALNIYWVEQELDSNFSLNNSEQYKYVYEKLYKYLEAVKNVKKFNNISEEGRKCSICGVRNALFLNKSENNNKFSVQSVYKHIVNDQEFCEKSLCELVDKLEKKKIKVSNEDIMKIKQESQLNYLNYEALKKNEMLCGVCLLKRIINYDSQNKIKSLAGICLSSYKEKNYKKGTQFYNYYNFIDKKIKESKKQCDVYESLYEENWGNFTNNLEEEREIVKKQIEEKFSNLNYKELPKYYCLYRMDIDNLGKWMSGEYKEAEESLYCYQRDLSQNISGFFNEIIKYFNSDSKGSLIYAGGDDLLALVPLDIICDLQCCVSRSFSEKVNYNYKYKHITYSQGVFIAHYKSPLGEVIRISKEEIEKTKDRFKEKVNCLDTEKDATVISILTDGYESRSVYFKNYMEDQQTYVLLYEELLKYFDKYNSSYFYEELEKEFLNFDNDIDKPYKRDLLLNMFELEQKRLMKRSIMIENYENVSKEELEERVDKINNKLMKFLEINGRKENGVDFENYFNLFHIIRKLGSDM